MKLIDELCDVISTISSPFTSTEIADILTEKVYVVEDSIYDILEILRRQQCLGFCDVIIPHQTTTRFYWTFDVIPKNTWRGDEIRGVYTKYDVKRLEAENTSLKTKSEKQYDTRTSDLNIDMILNDVDIWKSGLIKGLEFLTSFHNENNQTHLEVEDVCKLMSIDCNLIEN